MNNDEVILNTFFSAWLRRDIQKVILDKAPDVSLASILLVTTDIRAVVLAEYDKRDAKRYKDAAS